MSQDVTNTLASWVAALLIGGAVIGIFALIEWIAYLLRRDR